MNEPSLGALVAAGCVAAFVVGFLKTSVGSGIGLVLTPTLSLVLPAKIVLGLTAPLLNLADPITLWYFWRQWDGRQLRLLLPATLAGIGVGTWTLSLLSDLWLTRSIAVLALLFASAQLALLARGRGLVRTRPRRTVGAAAGILSGVASMIAHSGGIVMGPYLLSVIVSNTAVVATGAAVMAATNVVKLGSYWGIGFLTPRILAAAVLSAPLLVAGAWLGYRVNRWLPRRWFELALIALAMAGALRLLARG